MTGSEKICEKVICVVEIFLTKRIAKRITKEGCINPGASGRTPTAKKQSQTRQTCGDGWNWGYVIETWNQQKGGSSADRKLTHGAPGTFGCSPSRAEHELQKSENKLKLSGNTVKLALRFSNNGQSIARREPKVFLEGPADIPPWCFCGSGVRSPCGRSNARSWQARWRSPAPAALPSIERIGSR